MPECLDCGGYVAIYEYGTICPTCKRTYTPIESRALPGYEAGLFESALRMFKVLYSAGMLSKGFNSVHTLEDGLIIERLGEPE